MRRDRQKECARERAESGVVHMRAAPVQAHAAKLCPVALEARVEGM